MMCRFANAYRLPALAIALVTALAMPSVAANQKDLSRGGQAFANCINNIAAGRAPERGANKYALERYSSNGGITTYADKEEVVFLATSAKGASPALCISMIEGMTVKQANILAQGIAKKIKMTKTPPNDRRFSRMWTGAMKNGTLVILVEKKRSNGVYESAAMTASLVAN